MYSTDMQAARGDMPIRNGPGRGKRLAEQRHLIQGQGRFIDDLDLPGLVHVVFARSPHARARIRSIDASAALALPGVLRVLTAADLQGRVRPIRALLDPDGAYQYRPSDWHPLPPDEARYVGETVAAVVAVDRYVAEDAVERLDIDYEPLRPVARLEAALAADGPRVHENLPDNVLFHVRHGAPADDPCFSDPNLICVSGRFEHPRVAGLAMENNGVVADYDPASGELTVWSSTQIPHLIRDGLSHCLDMPAARLRVIAPQVGGAFGIKMQLYPEEILVAFLARELGCPVKWIQDRMENLMAATQARDAVVEAVLVAHPDGRLAGLRAQAWCDVGAYSCFPLTCALDAHTIGAGLPGPYRLPLLSYEAMAVATNKVPHGAYRGVGVPIGPLVTEGLLDQLAAQLGMDPLELRRKNLITPDQFPFQSASGGRYDSGDYPALLDLALRHAGYAQWREQQRQAALEGRRLGIGLACFVETTGMNRNTYRNRGMVHSPGFDSAILRVDPGGTLEVAVSTPSQGQTQATAFSYLLQDALGVSPDRIHVTLGDTARTPYGTGTYASRGMVSGGGAVLSAARKLQDRLVQVAALYWGVPDDTLHYQNGTVRRLDGSGPALGFADLARIAHTPALMIPKGGEPGLEVHSFYDPPVAPVSFSVHLVLAEVDPALGKVALLRYVVGEDCGPMVNQDAVEGQVRGGVAQGIGTALLEEISYDPDGQLLTATLADYLIPSSCDIPAIEIVHQSTPSPFTEGGLKGVGESGIIGAPAAVLAAVRDALGCHPHEQRLPLTPDRIRMLAQQKEMA
ncbi:xanthine dehydrogenase family protein molybdopterin-binding subunit [Castellaniella sp.]|uniref:xanthine dehydrogenase family protein molybdopterin-binding subunit n=1 Tax=Castellaniella sp. TaxID=1955812 RepID=UPI003561FA9E